MQQILSVSLDFLNLVLFDPRNPTEFWMKLIVAGITGGLFLNILAGILRLGNPTLPSGIVLFVGFGALLLLAMAFLQVQFGWLLKEQGEWIGAIVWTLAASLVLVAPLLKVTWPGGYGSAVFVWLTSWAGAMLAVVLVGATFTLMGAGRSVVKSDRARQAETRELLKLDR